MIVSIPFCKEMKQAILAGKKTCTSRNKRYGVAGDWFLLGKKKYIITSWNKCLLKDVSFLFYEEEGFNSPEEFIATWKKLHPRKGYDPKQMVFVHFFEEANG